jgi:hypothetical protein
LLPFIAVTLLGLSEQADAEPILIERGINYDKELLQINPDGSRQVQFSTAPERILNGSGDYVDYIFTDIGDALQLETAHGSVQLDKTTCEYSFFKRGVIGDGQQPIFIDDITPRVSTDGIDIWSTLSGIDGATCQASFDSGDVSLSAKKENGVGIVEYKYMSVGNTMKTQLEATNLSSLTDKKFGFIQTIDLNRDTIHFGGVQRDIDNFDGRTFDRDFLVNNEAKVIDLLNGHRFDFDLGFENLHSVYVNDTGVSKSQLNFDYTENAQIILPNQTLIIDPTFSTNATDGGWHHDNTNDGVCASTGVISSLTSSSITVGVDSAASFRDCITSDMEFDISGLGVADQIDQVDLDIDVNFVSNAGENADFTAIDQFNIDWQ